MIGRIFSVGVILAAAAAAQCLPSTGIRITAADLAMAEPRFKAIPQSQVIGFAPEPGARRTFAVAELERIARRNSLPTENLNEVCFEVPQRPLSRAELESAMRSELPVEAELTIIEVPATPQPVGKLMFPRSALEPPAQDGTQIWRGQIRYAETRKANLWTRVKVTQKVRAVVAATDLQPNTVIPKDALSVQLLVVPLTKDLPVTATEDVTGRSAKFSIKAGTPIFASSVQQPAAVKRGDAVKVEVQSGATKLVFDAVAERQGRDGEWIELRNPSSGKLFRARLSGAKAVIRL